MQYTNAIIYNFNAVFVLVTIIKFIKKRATSIRAKHYILYLYLIFSHHNEEHLQYCDNCNHFNPVFVGLISTTLRTVIVVVVVIVIMATKGRTTTTTTTTSSVLISFLCNKFIRFATILSTFCVALVDRTRYQSPFEIRL